MKNNIVNDMHIWYEYLSGKLQSRPARIIPPKASNRKKIIDLHGHTLNEAYQILIENIDRGYRELTVITGASGEIKRQFPLWLENGKLSHKVSNVTPINNGSFLVKLKVK